MLEGVCLCVQGRKSLLEEYFCMFFFFFKCPEKGVGVAGGGRNDLIVQSNLRHIW